MSIDTMRGQQGGTPTGLNGHRSLGETMNTSQATGVTDLLDSLTVRKPSRDEAGLILGHYLPLVHGASPAGEGYDQARRVLSATLQYDLDPERFDMAAEYGDQLTDAANGNCIYNNSGLQSTDENREWWIRHLNAQLSWVIDQLTAGIPE